MTSPSEPQIISYSELDTFRQCPLKHVWAYRERWVRPTEEGSALTRGSLWHAVMEAHYETIADWQARYSRVGGTLPTRMHAAVLEDCWTAVAVLLSDPESGQQSEDQGLVQWMYEGYVEQYGTDPQWKILAVEQRLELPLYGPTARHRGTPAFKIKARIDLLVEDEHGHRWVIDHKSGANLPTQFDLELDDQFGLYTWMLRAAGTPVLGAIHNAARTTRNVGDHPGATRGKAQTLEQRMHRTWLNRSDSELQALAIDAYNAAVNAYPEAVGLEPLPLYSAPDPRSCGWKCDFKEIHLLSRAGRDTEEVMQDYGFEQNFERH